MSENLSPSNEEAIVWTPLIGLAALLMLPEGNRVRVRAVAAVASAVPLVLTLSLLARFDRAATAPQFGESQTWIPELGMTYTLAVDGLSLPLILLTTLLVFIALLSSLHTSWQVQWSGPGFGGHGHKFVLHLGRPTRSA